jgi:tRNA nucleotidyltransferase (CCA-adding enzyme)
MRVILTHEQSDFDAIASLMGAFLLDETAIPVLPRKLNRNVHAFMTLYGAELPFVDVRDLPSELIDSVCLVDSQSMTSLKGMTSETKVHVVDHHPHREDLPADWTVIIEDVGATSTILVEQLEAQNGLLGVVHATLLLLGIYEDTGSLTYTRTTSRDLQAASYLLEQGASLRIAADFLNHPLSDQQRRLYDQLVSDVESCQINAHNVMIAVGDAQDVDEELSTLAHKLRDLHDPDLLILLMKTRAGVQLIARSTSDNIDVSAIADQFGGGGHARAAAALIKNRDLEEVHAELLNMLPNFIRPAVTVSEIMSGNPQLLAPDTPVEVVAERMQRFGYEGYPIVDDGKVVGLLTRRQVDRAIAHKLNLTAASLMDNGEVIVHPGDSIQYLQEIMTETGWGQIPVLSPETGEIIGIVTRTDLLKTLTADDSLPGRQNFAEKLERALPPLRLAMLKAVAKEASDQRIALYIVGGFVRDLLLERPSIDLDLVVEGDASQLTRSLNEKFGGRFKVHDRFGTAKWIIDDIRKELASSLGHFDRSEELPEFLDITSARTEFYLHPTALPTVESGSIKLDLHRRDFTINTLALRLDGHHYGELHDYWGGLNDLRHGLVRVLHSLSFVDDPTRMLRAVRFEQRFGFTIEERTLELLKEAITLIGRVSGVRIRNELDHIIDDEHFLRMFERLDELSLLVAIHPGLKWDQTLTKRMAILSNVEPPSHWCEFLEMSGNALRRSLAYILWILDQPLHVVKGVINRLRLANSQNEYILASVRLWKDASELTGKSPSEIVAKLEGMPPLAIYANYLAQENEEIVKLLELYATTWRLVSPNIDGHDLRERGIPPGPIYKEILRTIRNAWLDGKITNRQAENELLDSLLPNLDATED